MAEADTARLCVQIVHSHFGLLAAVSLPTGRVTFHTLVLSRIPNP